MFHNFCKRSFVWHRSAVRYYSEVVAEQAPQRRRASWRYMRSSQGLVLAAASVGAASMVILPRQRTDCLSWWFKAARYDLGVEPGMESALLSQAPVIGKAVAPEDVDIVLFHGGCPDGFAAAFAAYLLRGDACEYIGIGHGAGKKLPDNVDGKCIAILDFSFDKVTMDELLQRAKKVVVLDHHASAEEALRELPEANKVFEMKQSGATLAWDFFHGKRECPLLFRYIEDKDIWRWALRRSKAFSAIQDLELPVPRPGKVQNPADSFAPWKRVYDGGNKELDAVITKGAAIVNYQDRLITNSMRSARVRRLKVAPEHKAYVVDSSVLGSELGNALSL